VVLPLVLVVELVVVALVLVLEEVETVPLVLVELLVEVVVVGRLDEVVELELVEVVVTGAVELVVACTVVLVVVGGGGAVVVVLPAGTQPSGPHASQQLGKLPTQALPPDGALHAAAWRLMLHVVLPLASVRQQVTAPALPQVDLAAHTTTRSSHSGRSDPSSTACSVTRSTQSTYLPWFVALAQSQASSAAARVAATASSSPGTVPQAMPSSVPSSSPSALVLSGGPENRSSNPTARNGRNTAGATMGSSLCLPERSCVPVMRIQSALFSSTKTRPIPVRREPLCKKEG